MMVVSSFSAMACFFVATTAFVINVANADLVKMCLYYKPSGNVRADPILSQTCASDHVHTFYGPQRFHPQTTNEDLRNSDPKYSTSVYVENKSLYWHPTIYKVGIDITTGEKTYELAEISFAGPYYRWDKDAPAPQVEAFPKGFQMIAGNPVNGELLEGVNLISECLCPKPCARSDGLCESESNLFPSDACGEMGIAMNFPTCWNETAGLGDTGDHMSHMAYTVDGSVEGACPEGFNRRLPQIQLFVRVSNYEGGQYTFSDNTLPEDEEVFHADFMEGWMGDTLENIIENCVPTQNDGDPFNPPCTCHQFLTKKETLLTATEEEPNGSFDAEAGNICDIDTKSYIINEEVTFGVGGLPRGSCSAPLIPTVNGVDPPFVEDCGLQFQPPTFFEDDCDGDGGESSSGSGSLSEDGDDDDDDENNINNDEIDNSVDGDDDDDEDDSNENDSGSGSISEDGDDDDDDDNDINNDEIDNSVDGDDDDDEDNSNENNDDEDENEENEEEEEESCKDDIEFRFKGAKKKNCQWVAKNTDSRCDMKFKGKRVWESCPSTCGDCSNDNELLVSNEDGDGDDGDDDNDDDENEQNDVGSSGDEEEEEEEECKNSTEFRFKGKKKKSCKWVHGQVKKKGLQFCNKKVNKKKRIKDFCKKACKQCDSNIFV